MRRAGKPQQEGGFLRFLYGSMAGRMVLKVLTRPFCSNLGKRFLDTSLSSLFIDSYIKKNQIEMDRFRPERYRSFNHFFTRQLKALADFSGAAEGVLGAPCDGKLSVYRLRKDCVFQVKNSCYTVAELIGSRQRAAEFRRGFCLIFRLTPDDYHRYHFFDDGEITFYREIPGKLHTVRPIAHHYYPVFTQNARAAAGLQTRHFGPAVQIEVGAMMVGKISNQKTAGSFKAGEEKGHFEFGGSTIIVLLKEGQIVLRKDLEAAMCSGAETAVRAGEVIGRKPEGGADK